MSRKQIILVGLGGFVLGAIVAAIVAGFVVKKTVSQLSATGQPATQSQQPTNCGVTNGSVTISGDSMKGILDDGQKATVLTNYYACHDVARGDIVVYNYPGGSIVKKVMGVPGDTFGLQASGTAWKIMINGQPLKNAQGAVYAIANSKMLAYYASSYHGTIPSGAYLILGNDPGGSNDSTAFGLVAKEDFLGKVQQ